MFHKQTTYQFLHLVIDITIFTDAYFYGVWLSKLRFIKKQKIISRGPARNSGCLSLPILELKAVKLQHFGNYRQNRNAVDTYQVWYYLWLLFFKSSHKIKWDAECFMKHIAILPLRSAIDSQPPIILTFQHMVLMLTFHDLWGFIFCKNTSKACVWPAKLHHRIREP